jgi:outer membrane protein, heavy metal efflux system
MPIQWPTVIKRYARRRVVGGGAPLSSVELSRPYSAARYLASLLSVVLLTAFSGPILAEGVVLTEQDVLVLFYQRNLNLIAARYDLEQSKAQEIIAAAIPNPVFSLDVNGLLSRNNNAGQGPGTIARIDQLIETAGKRHLRMESSKLGTRATEKDLQDAVRTFSNAVRHSFYGLLLAQKTLALTKDNLAHYEEILRANRLRLQKGDIAESDFLRIEVEGLKAQSELDKATADLKKVHSDLAVLLAWPEHALQFVAQDGWPMPREIGQSQGENALLNKALTQRPDLQAAKFRIDQAQRDLSLARKLHIPDVTVGIGYAHDPSNLTLDSADVGISLSLPLFYRYQGEVGKAVVSLNNAQLQSQQAEQAVRADVVSALAAWQSTHALVHRFEGDILNRILKVRKAAELAYSKGATSILDLIDAERNYKAMMLDYYTALNNRTLAYVDLLASVGEEPRP